MIFPVFTSMAILLETQFLFPVIEWANEIIDVLTPKG